MVNSKKGKSSSNKKSPGRPSTRLADQMAKIDIKDEVEEEEFEIIDNPDEELSDVEEEGEEDDEGEELSPPMTRSAIRASLNQSRASPIKSEPPSPPLQPRMMKPQPAREESVILQSTIKVYSSKKSSKKGKIVRDHLKEKGDNNDEESDGSNGSNNESNCIGQYSSPYIPPLVKFPTDFGNCNIKEEESSQCGESQLNGTIKGTADSSAYGQDQLSLDGASEILLTERNLAVLQNEEFRAWKRNIPYTYNFCMAAQLEWPSMTVEWMPETLYPQGKDYSIHRIVLGTHAANDEDNRLLIYRLHLSNHDAEVISDFTESRLEHGFGELTTQLYCHEEYRHEGRVHRARVMPQRSTIVATKGPTSKVFLYDVSKRSESLRPSGPYQTLEGHSKGGFALQWSRVEKGSLLSGSDDGTVCLWDVEGTKDKKPTRRLRVHEGRVNDVDFSRTVPGIYASCGEDKKVIVWDARSELPLNTLTNYTANVTCVAFQPDSDRIFATGTADGKIYVRDMRNLNWWNIIEASHSITSIQWCPQHETIFATTGTDGRVLVWDLYLTEYRQTPLTSYDREQGPDELMFVHGGHMSSVPEISWCSTVPLMMASIDRSNMMYITRMGQWNVSSYHIKRWGARRDNTNV